MNDDTPATIGGKAKRTTQPYVSPPYRIDDARAIEIANDIMSNALVPVELYQLCDWVVRRAVPPKPLPAGLRVARLGDPPPEVSDLELRDRARAAAGLPLCRRANEPDFELATCRDLELDEPKIVVDMEMP